MVINIWDRTGCSHSYMRQGQVVVFSIWDKDCGRAEEMGQSFESTVSVVIGI